MPSYSIKLQEPTVPCHKKYYIHRPTLVVSTAHIIPEILDIERFNFARSETLLSFLHLAGRLVRPDVPEAGWKIRLTNSGVPVSLIDNDADEIVPTDLTVQTSLHLMEPLNAGGIVNTDRESGASLLQLQSPGLRS